MRCERAQREWADGHDAEIGVGDLDQAVQLLRRIRGIVMRAYSSASHYETAGDGGWRGRDLQSFRVVASRLRGQPDLGLNRGHPACHILVLLRSDFRGTFSDLIKRELHAMEIAYSDPDVVTRMLAKPSNRRMLDGDTRARRARSATVPRNRRGGNRATS